MKSQEVDVKQMIVVLFAALQFVAVSTLHAEDYTHKRRNGTREALAAFLEAMRRPESGPGFVYSDRFVVHFDTAGEHATTRAYAESVSVYAEHAWRIQVDSLGKIPPPLDYGEGGDDRYDIYIRNTVTGHCNPESSLVPGHPGVNASFLVVRRSFEDWNALRGAVTNGFNAALDMAARPVRVRYRLIE